MGTGHRAVMHEFRSFLESSTIHGLTYISSTRKYVRLFWIFVVITGFSAASFMIYQSFQAWEENPVSTNIETLPITEITFPKVTVCPPKGTYTDLNYDLMITEKMVLDNEVRTNLSKYAVELLQDHLHHVVMTNFSKLQEDNMYRKWYLGYSKIQGPEYKGSFTDIQLHLNSDATSGTITTEHYGEKFDADKVEPDIRYVISIHPPESVLGNCPGVTLNFEVEKNSMQNIVSGWEVYREHGFAIVNADIKNITRNYCPPGKKREFYSQRKISSEDMKNMDMEFMPGFKLKWHYTSDSAGEIQPDAWYHRETITKMFIR